MTISARHTRQRAPTAAPLAAPEWNDRAFWLQVLALAILFVWYAGKIGQVFIDLEGGDRRVVLSPYSKVIEDTGNQWTIGDVTSPALQQRFDTTDQTGMALGIAQSSFWIRIDLREILREHPHLFHTPRILEVSRPNISLTELYTRDRHDDRFEIQRLTSSDESRPVEYPTSAFLLDADPDRDSQIYVRIRNNTSTPGLLLLWEPRNFLRKVAIEQNMQGIFYGGVIVLLLYNLCMYISMQQRVHLYYMGYLAGAATFLGTEQGQVVALFESPDIEFVKWLIPVSGWIAWTFVFLFVAEFLDTRTRHRGWHTTLGLITALTGMGVLLSLLAPFSISILAVALFTLPLLVVILLFLFAAVIQGDENARIMLLAWSINALGCLIFTLSALGIIQPSVMTEAAMPTGILLEALLMSFSLADKIKRAQRQVDEENQRTLDLMHQYSLELEDKVRERTRDLEDTQQELVIKQQMAAMGVLTAGMAHEINNPNNFVSAGVQNLTAWKESFENLVDDLLSDEADPVIKDLFRERFSALDTHLAGLSSSSDNISTIVTGLRTITRLDEADMKEVDAADGMLQIMRFLRAGIGKGIEFTSLVPDRPKVLCYPAELNSAFMALMTNAIQAVRDREHATLGPMDGSIHIESHVIEERHRRFLHITLKDNGCGMSAKTLSKAFEPFFTTRAAGAGAGLGLSISRDTIEKHGGTLTLTSTAGQGTRVTIRLPVAMSA
jgi:two-component system NtrC family sensor kinase